MPTASTRRSEESHKKGSSNSKSNNNSKRKNDPGGRRKDSIRDETGTTDRTVSASARWQEAAELAFLQDPRQALTLYDAAEQALWPTLPLALRQILLPSEESSTRSTSTTTPAASFTLNCNHHNSDDDDDDEVWMDQLLTLLEKRAAVHVALGLDHQDLAKADYQQAANYLQRYLSSSSTRRSSSSSTRATTTTTVEEEDDPAVVGGWERLAALYLYMGQLSAGHTAVEHFQQGLTHLEQAWAARSHTGDPPARAETRRDLARAYCTMAELYLTDLCMEDEAEQQCEAYVDRARQLYPPPPNDDNNNQTEPMLVDVLQVWASLRLSQRRPPEATSLMGQVYRQLQPGCQALASLVWGRMGTAGPTTGGETAALELLDLDVVQNLPGFEFRCQTAKLLLECAAAAASASEDPRLSGTPELASPTRSELLEAAVQVLGSLLAENDEVVEIWSLLGDAHAAHLQTEAAMECWERALDMLSANRQVLEEETAEAETDEQEIDAQRQLDEVLCQIEELQSKLEEAAVGADEDDPMDD